MAEAMDVDSDKPKVVKRPANSGGDASTQPWVSYRFSLLFRGGRPGATCMLLRSTKAYSYPALVLSRAHERSRSTVLRSLRIWWHTRISYRF